MSTAKAPAAPSDRICEKINIKTCLVKYEVFGYQNTKND